MVPWVFGVGDALLMYQLGISIHIWCINWRWAPHIWCWCINWRWTPYIWCWCISWGTSPTFDADVSVGEEQPHLTLMYQLKISTHIWCWPISWERAPTFDVDVSVKEEYPHSVVLCILTTDIFLECLAAKGNLFDEGWKLHSSGKTGTHVSCTSELGLQMSRLKFKRN